MTDTERMNWLMKNCTYFEWGGRDCKDGFWPHEDDMPGVKHFKPDFVGLHLRDYIDSQLIIEHKDKEEEYHRQAADRIDQLIESRLYREVE